MSGYFDDEEAEPERPRRDTELTLGSGALLAMFFGLGADLRVVLRTGVRGGPSHVGARPGNCQSNRGSRSGTFAGQQFHSQTFGLRAGCCTSAERGYAEPCARRGRESGEPTAESGAGRAERAPAGAQVGAALTQVRPALPAARMRPDCAGGCGAECASCPARGFADGADCRCVEP